MPPLRIRMAKELNNKLGRAAIIDGYVQIPIYTYTEKTVQDDVAFTGCPYVAKTDSYYWSNPQITFKNITGDFMSVLRDPIAVAFNLTQDQKDNLNYNNLYDNCDILVAEKF
jgi:hypothetical protein